MTKNNLKTHISNLVGTRHPPEPHPRPGRSRRSACPGFPARACDLLCIHGPGRERQRARPYGRHRRQRAVLQPDRRHGRQLRKHLCRRRRRPHDPQGDAWRSGHDARRQLRAGREHRRHGIGRPLPLSLRRGRGLGRKRLRRGQRQQQHPQDHPVRVRLDHRRQRRRRGRHRWDRDGRPLQHAAGDRGRRLRQRLRERHEQQHHPQDHLRGRREHLRRRRGADRGARTAPEARRCSTSPPASQRTPPGTSTSPTSATAPSARSPPEAPSRRSPAPPARPEPSTARAPRAA